MVHRFSESYLFEQRWFIIVAGYMSSSISFIWNHPVIASIVSQSKLHWGDFICSECKCCLHMLLMKRKGGTAGGKYKINVLRYWSVPKLVVRARMPFNDVFRALFQTRDNLVGLFIALKECSSLCHLVDLVWLVNYPRSGTLGLLPWD